MTEAQIGISGIAGLLALIALRVPIAFAMISVGAVGLTVLIGFGPMTGLLRSLPYEFAASWALSSLPTFLVMGYVAYHAQLTQGLFRAAQPPARRSPAPASPARPRWARSPCRR